MQWMDLMSNDVVMYPWCRDVLMSYVHDSWRISARLGLLNELLPVDTGAKPIQRIILGAVVCLPTKMFQSFSSENFAENLFSSLHFPTNRSKLWNFVLKSILLWLNVSCNIHAWSIGFPTSRTQYPKCCVHFATALVSAQIKNDGLGSFARPIEECKLGHIGRVQLGPITTHTTEIRLKDFQFRLATVHQGQFAHKEWQPCQFELLKRHLSHKSGKVKPVKSNPFKSTQNPNLVMRCFLYHKVANENATESPWHACLSASCPGSELLKAVAMRPIRLTAQQAKGGTLKSSFFNWNHWKILVHWYE